MTAKPITPDQIAQRLAAKLPDFVIETWNDVIAKNWSSDDNASTVTKSDITRALIVAVPPAMDLVTVMDVESNEWLEILDLYTLYGWDVRRSRPNDEIGQWDTEYEFKIKVPMQQNAKRFF